MMLNPVRHGSFLSVVVAFLFLNSCIHPAHTTQQKHDAVLPGSTREIELKRTFGDACKEKIKGNLELAVTGFNECLRIDPDNGASHYELAAIYNQQERNDLALAHAKGAAEQDPKNEWYLFLYAQLLQETHKASEAADQFHKLMKLSPDKPEYYYGYSDALLYQGKYKEAIKVYEEIELQHGASEETSLQKAKVFDRMGETEKAEAEIHKLMVQDPTETKYYVFLSQLFLDKAAAFKAKGNTEKENEMTEKAHLLYTDLLKADPGNPYALLSLAEYYLGKEKYDSAYVQYKAALLNPDLDIDSKVKVALKYFYESEKDEKLKAECEELCHILTTVHPNEAKAHAVMGDFLYREKRKEEARMEYRKAVDLDKSKYVIWNQLLVIDSELNDYTDMLRDSKDATELFPSMPIPYFFYGLALLQERKYEEAIDALNGGVIYVLDNKPLESQFYANLGDAYHKTKSFQKSDEAYDKALALDPDNAYVLNNYAYYLSLRNENLDKAEKMSKHSNELETKNANFQDTYAWILYRQGKFEQALDWQNKALSATGDPSAVMLEHYGDMLYHLNRKEEAFTYWMKSKTKGGGSEFLEKKIADKKMYE
ncbi:MAG TPA: tetratricopeptide repeat protein [Bacteroidia bacterium]|jgi:tetratricopeptide (TPR) repeat protein|nr:tetratricopeptide repeat protein [Bacteroidia bacterium]